MKKYLYAAGTVLMAAVLATGCVSKTASVDGHYKTDLDVGGSVTVSEAGMVAPDVMLPVELALSNGEYVITLDTDSMARDFEDAKVDDHYVVDSVDADEEVVYAGHYTVEDSVITFEGDMHFTCSIEDGSLIADHFLGFDDVAFAKR